MPNVAKEFKAKLSLILRLGVLLHLPISLSQTPYKSIPFDRMLMGQMVPNKSSRPGIKAVLNYSPNKFCVELQPGTTFPELKDLTIRLLVILLDETGVLQCINN